MSAIFRKSLFFAGKFGDDTFPREFARSGVSL